MATEAVEAYARYAVIEDPPGATILLFDLERKLGGNEGQGSWVWAELWTGDLEASTTFHTEVIGYKRDETGE